MKPNKVLTLVFVHQNNQILLAMKKRGFGAGKYNGFGGKVENETVLQAAIRETQEEGNITPTDLVFMGLMNMVFDCEPEIFRIHVFKATQFTGNLEETEEMKPEWVPIDLIPYDRMWVDDRLWLPYLINNQFFYGNLTFQGHEQIIEQSFKILTQQELHIQQKVDCLILLQ